MADNLYTIIEGKELQEYNCIISCNSLPSNISFDIIPLALRIKFSRN